MKGRMHRKTLAFILSLAMLNTMPASIFAVDMPGFPAPNPENNFNSENGKPSGVYINNELVSADSDIIWYNQIWGFEVAAFGPESFEITKDGVPVPKEIKPYEMEDGVYDVTIRKSPEEVYTYSFGLDRTKPEFRIIYNPDSKKMRFICQPDDSGIAKYSVNGPNQYVEPDEYGVIEDAESYGAATILDGAGNYADFKSPERYEISVDTNGYTAEDTPSRDIVKLDVSLVSEISGIGYKFQYSRDDENWNDVSSENRIFAAGTNGRENYIIRAVCDDESEFEICRTAVEVNVNAAMSDNTTVMITGETDEKEWYTELPEVVITAPFNKDITYRVDGARHTLNAGCTETVSTDYFTEGIHTLEVDVFDEKGKKDIETYFIKINMVQPEIDSVSVEAAYRLSDDESNVYCHGDLKLRFNLNSEVDKIVPVCDGKPLDPSLYTIERKNTVAVNYDAYISGKLGITAYDKQESEITYYIGEISKQYANSFNAETTLSYNSACKFVYENTVLDVPEIKAKYRNSSNAEVENDFKDSSSALKTEWTKNNIRVSFVKQSEKEFQYQYRKSGTSEWVDCGSSFELSEGGEYIFRSVSETGVYSSPLTVDMRISRKEPKQGVMSVQNRTSTNNEWYRELELELRNENAGDDSVPNSTVYCDVYRTGTNGTSKIGRTEIGAGRKADIISMSEEVTATDENSAALFKINTSGIYEFRYYTVDESGNRTDEASDVYRVQCEEPVIYSLNLKDINLMTEKNLYFMSADLSELSVDADFGFSGKADSDAVVYEYKSKLSNEWKRCDNVKLYIDSKYDIRVTIKNKAGMTAVTDNVSVIVDTKQPVGENNFPEIKIAESGTSQNGIYSSAVDFDIYVRDPKENNVCSGLKTVSYTVKDNETGEIVIDKTVFEHNSDKSESIDDVSSEFAEKITVPAWVDTNFTLTVDAVDNAGNTRTSSKVIKQDTSAPEIVVSYDNNNIVNGMFNASRTAKITVDERNFNPSDVSITASNSEGADPKISSWSSNGNIHTATVAFTDDGSYSFDISYTDKAGNKAEIDFVGESPKAFRIDKTAPVVDITYDNYDAVNGYYYNRKRTARITVQEKNLDSDSLQSGVRISAVLDGKSVKAPEISWSSGENNTSVGTVEFSDNAQYTLNVSVRDTAGNSAGIPTQSFTVDTKAPIVTISGVNNKSANKDSLMPVIEYSDSNLDENNVSIKITGANNGEIGIIKESYKVTNGMRIAVNNFADAASLKDDDLYILNVTVTDKAGLSTNKKIEFSINRTGPVYVVDPQLEDYLNKYNKDPRDIKISVYDVDPIVESHISVVKDGNETSTIFAGRDYNVTTIMPDAEQEIYRYTYEYVISAKNFENNGTYNIILTAKDNAANSSDNTASKLGLKDDEEKETSTKIMFTIDNIAPTLIFDDLSSNGKYNTDSKKVSFIMHDNISALSLDSIQVFVNGQKVNVTDDGEKYQFTMGSSSNVQDVLVVCKDIAGNINELSFENILVTSDKFKLYQKQIIAALIAIMALLISGTIFITKKNSKKNKFYSSGNNNNNSGRL